MTKSLREALAEGKTGEDFAAAISAHARGAGLASAEDAEAFVAVLDRIPAGTKDDMPSGPLFAVAALFQTAKADAIVDVLREGFPRFIALYDRVFASLGDVDDRDRRSRRGDLLFALKVFAQWPRAGGDEALRRVIEAARDPQLNDAYLWSVVFGIYGSDGHPNGDELVRQLRSPLPVHGFAAVAFLDFANTLCLRGAVQEHPYADAGGLAFLEELLRQSEDTSYAQSATTALPFLPAEARARLMPLAQIYPSVDVRIEAAWADAKCGGTAGFATLERLCTDVHVSRRVQGLLEELGHGERIPGEALEPDFLAAAEMSSWLQHPNEFGAAPDKLVLFDTRELFWPPADELRRVWLFQYTYEKGEHVGLGMVGGITFALSTETEGLSAEDAYAMHCCWELQMNEDPRAPEKRSIAAGRELLKLAVAQS